MEASDYCDLLGRILSAGMLSYQSAQLGIALRGRSGEIIIPSRQIRVGQQLELGEKSSFWGPMVKKVCSTASLHLLMPATTPR